MSYQTIILDKNKYISTITLNRPEKLNALNLQMRKELDAVLRLLDDDDETRVIVLTGNGRAFCSGADTKEFDSREEEVKRKERDVIKYGTLGKRPLFIPNIGKPTIAAVNGLAVGGGCLFALNSDIRIAAESARFKFPFAELGGSQELGSSYFLPRLIGIAKACELVFTAKWVGAEEAKEIGLVNHVVPDNELLQATYEMAETITKYSPIAVRACKKGLYLGMENNLAHQLQWEALALHYTRSTEDFKEATVAARAKREGNYKGK